MIDKNNLALAVAEKMLSGDKPSQFLDVEIVVAQKDYSVCSMVIGDNHLNGHGTCHGGAIFTLADTTFAHLCNASNQLAVAHICHIAYWAPAAKGDKLFAVGKENGVYGRSGSYAVSVHKGSVDGEVIAEFSGYSRLIKDKTVLDQ